MPSSEGLVTDKLEPASETLRMPKLFAWLPRITESIVSVEAQLMVNRPKPVSPTIKLIPSKITSPKRSATVMITGSLSLSAPGVPVLP